MTTNKHQPPAPPERVWLEFFGGNVRGVSVYVPEWHDNTPITHRLERIKQNGFSYARVHEVDEGRVRDGSACLHETCTRPLDCRYYCMERHSRLCVEPRNRIGLARTEAGKCEHGVLWSMECLSCGHSDFEAAPVSSSERRCGECGHVDAIDPHGRCMSVYYDAGGSLVYCGCKCVFPASTKETAEQFERDFAAWQRKVNESIEATRQLEILTAEDFNIRINARADDPALAMAPAPKEHIVECGVWTDPNAACTCIESDTPTAAATAEIDRLTSELKAVQERAASEISELAVAVTDLKFELYNAGFEIEQLNAEVERLRNQRDSARANAINEALIAVEDLRKAYPESVFTRHLLNVVIAALESLKQKESSFQK